MIDRLFVARHKKYIYVIACTLYGPIRLMLSENGACVIILLTILCLSQSACLLAWRFYVLMHMSHADKPTILFCNSIDE